MLYIHGVLWAVIFGVCVLGQIGFGEGRRKLHKVERLLIGYCHENGAIPEDLTFIDDPSLLTCKGAPIGYRAEDMRISFDVPFPTPIKEIKGYFGNPFPKTMSTRVLHENPELQELLKK